MIKCSISCYYLRYVANREIKLVLRNYNVDIMQRTMYNVRRTMYSVLCAMYDVHGTLCIVRRTLYIDKCI